MQSDSKRNSSSGKSRPFRNPLELNTPFGIAQQCPDPTIIRNQDANDRFWYLYCTGGPLNEADRDKKGRLRYRYIPIYRSLDLVFWEYQGDVLPKLPIYGLPSSKLWAPEVKCFGGRYYLYYVVTKTVYSGSAIGVAISDHPLGPWVDSERPVIEPHSGPGTRRMPRWCYDPAILSTRDGQNYIFYGSYYGGISARLLSEDGLSSDPITQIQITVPNRYEAANLIENNGYYYLFASACKACNGRLTGYAVFCGRSRDPLGPFFDRDGNSLLSSRVGGTPVLRQNGNRWVGPGHECVFNDFSGQTWMLYHATDVNEPFFATISDFDKTAENQKRQLLMDRLDWVAGWPVVLNGPCDRPQAVPMAQPDDHRIESRRSVPFGNRRSAQKMRNVWFEDFHGPELKPEWAWMYPAKNRRFHVGDSCFSLQTHHADLRGKSKKPSILTRQLPPDEWMIETRVSLNVPPDGSCHNFVQGGLVVYADADNFIKLVVASIWETRQTEFAKACLDRMQRLYGNSVIGAPGDWTELRILRQLDQETEYYTGFTRASRQTWVRGGTWTHKLGQSARIGLVSMGGSGFVSRFDYVRVFILEPRDSHSYRLQERSEFSLADEIRARSHEGH